MHDPLETEALLLSILLNTTDPADDPTAELEGIIDSTDFWSRPHQLIFEAAEQIAAAGGVPNSVLVAEHLDTNGRLEDVGALPGIIQISGRYASRNNLAHLAHRVAAYSGLRATATVAEQIARLAEGNPDNIEQIVDDSGRLVDGLAANVSRTTVRGIGSTLAAYRAQMDTPAPTVPTGFAELDGMIGGYGKGDLSLVGAPSGHGKTSMLVKSAMAACQAGRPTVFQTLEMSEAEVIDRMVAVLARIDLSKVSRRSMTQHDRLARDAALAEIEGWPLTVDPDPEPTLGGMKSAARAIRREHGEVGLWLFDYMQLWKPGVGRTYSRQEEVAEASRALKKFAKVEDLPMAGAVQLNNMAAGRADKRPQMQDIRESSAPYHDASVVVFLYRPGAVGDVCESENDTELIVRKQRNGPTGTIHVDWVPQYSTFTGRGVRRHGASDGLTPSARLASVSGRAVPTAGDDGAPGYDPHPAEQF